MAAPAWATNPVLLIQGTGGSGGDVTAFIDQVQVVQVSNSALIGSAVANAGFETPSIGATNYVYTLNGYGWTFNAQSGIASNGSAFNNPTAQDGSQVAFIQIAGNVQQTLTLGTGTYVLKFLTAQRNCCGSGFNQGLAVSIGGVNVGSITPVNDGTWQQFTSSQFTVDAPAVTALAPARNALTAALASSVAVTFSQNIDNATASNIKVFSAQAGGKKAGSYSTSGGTVTFAPTTAFKPGETVFTSIPAAVASTGGATTTNKQVYQFTTAAGGTGRGNFQPGSTIGAAGGGYEVIAADFNGDGILDLADTGGGLTVRLGTGGGAYGTGTVYASAGGGFTLTAGDLDGDGDLDLVVPRSSGTIAIMQNNGGNFTALPAAASNGSDPRKPALGDIDADGDLDMLVPLSAGGGAVGVYFNNGSGTFSAPTSYPGSANSTYVVLGDVDRDGDLDYAVADYNNAAVVVRLNNGNGVFSGGSNVTVGNNPGAVALADVNGDNALDILTPNEGATSVSVALNANNGTGSFGSASSYTLPATSSGLAVGDVDADGDLDVVAGSRGATGFYELLNNGSGTFGAASIIAATNAVFYLTLADLDNDGDLDLAGAANNGSNLFVRLNQPIPTITSILPNPGVRGQAVTVTGTNLSGVTAVSVNGVAAATNSFVNNTATSLTFQVPATAGASGTTTLTTAVGPASSTTFTTVAATPPGNALAIDNGTNYVDVNTQAGISNLATSGYTLEAWVYLNTVSGVQSVIRKDGDYNFYFINGLPRTQIWSPATTLRENTGTTALVAGRWYHVAGTWDGTNLRVYLNGVEVTGGTNAVAFTAYNLPLRLGRSSVFNEPLNGRLDEVRIYNTPLTQSQIQADMVSTSSSQANLKAYYNFDQGTAGGNNAGQTTLYDQTGSGNTGTLNNFALTGTASNWVESYALVVPAATAATAITGTGFTANWTAPAIGTVDNGYRVDVSTSSTFASVVAGSPFTAASGTSLAITGLANNTTYYYRVRADKTSVTGQGATSNVISFTTPPLPSITSISPNPGVRGEAVTVTGTGLSGVTSVSVNGVAATAASFVNNTATSLTFQVPASAGATGTTSVTTAGGTANVTTFNTAAATPPGNALAFDGADDYVPFGSTPAVNNLGPGSFTMEAWVYYDGGTGAESIIRKDGDYNFYINNQTLHAEVWTSGTSSSTWQRIDGTATTLPANRWTHVAAVWNGSTMQLYINGVAEASTVTTGSISASANLTLGKSQVYGNLLNGRLDEVRIYTAALTQANVQVDMLSTTSSVPASLKFYLNFDQGTAGGNNAGQTTLYDQSSNVYAGTLTNFALTGTTSNWVESYALVVPTATAATAVTGTGFTANWTAPAVGTVDNGYRVDVSTSNTFASVVAGSPFTAASGTSLAITGLANNTTYYYRVRADKTSVTGQGDYSNVISFTTLPLPTISSFSPNPAGVGIPVTLTGTNLSGATSLTINGAAATILTNTGTAITFKVPAGATATGTSSVVTPGGTASSTAFVFLPAPGNALVLDGANDYVRIPDSNTLDFGSGDFTVEAWVLKQANSSGYTNALAPGGKWNTGATPGTNEWLLQTTAGGNDNLPSFLIESGTTTYAANGTVPVPLNRWTHLAGVRQGSSLLLYVNGVLQTTTAIPAGTVVNNVGRELLLGAIANGGTPGYFINGRLDELRIWNTARSQAQLQAGLTAPVAATTTGLVAYYSFDEGTSGGTNTGLTTLYDLTSNANHGTLNNFALTGTASNWVESYAMVVPTATAATSVAANSFTANWTAPATGIVDNGYRVEVSASSTFASGVTTYTTSSTATSQAVTGLTPSTTYYYRVWADKTSVTGQGDYSNTITVPTCALPVAKAQNATVTLNSSGSATLAATAVNNGSTANCGTAAAGALSVSPSSFSCSDAVTPPVTNAALSFNGTTQYAEGTNANLPLGNTARTIEAWVYPTAAGANGIVFNYGTPTTNLRSGILLNNGNLYYVGENNDLRGNIALTVNAWNHVAATYDGTTLKLYVNGVLDVQRNPSAFNTTGTIWRIAQRSYPDPGEFLTGRVDEVRVWNVARTAQQVKDAMSASLPSGTAGLVACYRLNENTGSTTADATASASTGTLYNAPTWTTGAPVTPGQPVTLTVTDANGNTSTATAIVAVRDLTAPAAAGSGPLPAAPVLATSNVPEAGNYGVLYQLDIPNAASFNSLSSVPYAVNNSGASIARPSRVAYFMELQSGGVTKWVWASMDNFASTLAQLGMPNPTANNVVWNQNVSNLNVFASSNAGVTTGTSLGTGRLEMWTTDYQPNNASNVPGASGSLYDFGDQPAVNRNYGSFQVHNVTAGQTLLAYNNWGSNGDGGGIGDVGIGNQVGGSGHPDWTFAYNASTYTVKRLYILVPNNGAFTQPATVTLNASGTATLTQSQVYTGGVTDNCAVSSVVVSPTTFTCAQTSTPQLVTVAVSDASGNTTTQSAYVTVTIPPTATTTWNGSSSTSWTDCANWSYGKVPDATTSAVIPTGQPRYPVLTTGSNPVLDLTINAGGSLTLNGGVTLQVNGNFTNSGTATLGGTVAFVGSAATQTLNVGSGFTTVTVNKPSGTVQLAQNLTINSALTLTSGTLTTTSSYQVNLGGSASISESDASYVLGKVVVNRTLVAGTSQPFSGLGLTLTPAAGSTAPGATLVTRVTGTALNGAGTSASILRYFDIQPTINTGLNVTMDFAYFNHELNGIPVGNLALFKSVSGGTPWIPQRGTTAGTNVVTKTGITDFSVWTLGNSANPLPVELAVFTATPLSHAVLLKWSTASEKNSARFEVERSLDGTSFDRLGAVAAAGSSTTPREYALTDAQLPAGRTMLYYRLKQVDLDATFSYSPVRSVRLSEATEGLALFPNPTTARTTLTGAQPGTTVQVFDALGRVVASATTDATGTADLTLPAGLATGVYVVRTGTKALRLTVE